MNFKPWLFFFFLFVQFVPKTHYFFSVSKDKTLKYWDADKFEHITTLQVKFSFMTIYTIVAQYSSACLERSTERRSRLRKRKFCDVQGILIFES